MWSRKRFVMEKVSSGASFEVTRMCSRERFVMEKVSSGASFEVTRMWSRERFVMEKVSSGASFEVTRMWSRRVGREPFNLEDRLLFLQRVHVQIVAKRALWKSHRSSLQNAPSK